MTYNVLEDVYLLNSGRKIKRLEIWLQGPNPQGKPFQWRAASWPATELTQAERQEIAAWFTAGLESWASQPDEPESSEVPTGPRLVVLDRSSGALV